MIMCGIWSVSSIKTGNDRSLSGSFKNVDSIAKERIFE
jgi:hypothetical protein